MDGAERAVPLDELHSGDLVVVKTGQRIPVDGVIEEGQAALDESDLTGESMPVDKTAGDRVISGTFNGPGISRYVRNAWAGTPRWPA